MRETNRTPLLVNITGTNGKTTTSRILEITLTKLGLAVGLAGTVGIYYKGTRIKKKDRSGPKSYEYLHKRSPKLDIVICENVLRHIRLGHYYPDKADICLITNIANDHIHQTRSQTIEEIAEIKSRLINRNKKHGLTILNGDNRYTLNIAKKLSPDSLILFTQAKHKPNKLRSFDPLKIYFIDDDDLKVIQNDEERTLIRDISKLPLTLRRKIGYNIENLLAAISVLDNLPHTCIDYQKTQKILNEIKLTFDNFPGRFNIYDFKTFTVILDDAHNPDSYKKMFKTIKKIDHQRLVSVIKASITRTDTFIEKIGEIAAKNSDFIYVKESFSSDSPNQDKLRGKVARLLVSGIKKVHFDMDNMKVIFDQERAVTRAIKNAQKGDLIVIFGYKIDRLHKLIEELKRKLGSS